MRKILCCFTFFAMLICTAMPCSAAFQAECGTSAAAYVVMDAVSRRVLYESNAHLKLPMASTTKIMSALLCLESGGLDSEFTVDSEAIKAEGSSMGLTEGDIVTKRALCYGMLLPSGNDAAGAAAVEIAGSYGNFAQLMNERAAIIGMEDTHFVTPSGLHDEEHYSTAYDMGLLTAEALENEDFRTICSQTSAKIKFGNPPFERWLTNTNKLLTLCDGVVGVKTGFTDEAGRCLVSACVRGGITLICVTLNDKNDWQDHANLYDEAFSAAEAEYAPMPSDIKLPVAGSSISSVPLYAKENVVCCRLSSDIKTSDIRWEAEAAPFLFAPVKKDSIQGYLVHYCGEYEISRQPLFAACDAEYMEVQKENKNIFEDIRERLLKLLS
ncbi:MAG: D-alanyl-D-alanine carboxypeptidase family protein [Ruminococcus sp.]